MIQFILDTDKLSLLQRKHPKVVALVGANRDVTAVSAISIEEQFSGWFTRMRQARSSIEYAKTSSFLAANVEMLSQFPIVPMTEMAIDRYEILKKYKPSLNIGGNDLRIAAIALELGATVVTRNTRDFSRVPGLQIVDWSV